MYRGHEIRMLGGRYKTYAPRRGYESGSLQYTGSFNTLPQARKWVREQEEAWARMTNQAARNKSGN